MNGIQFFRHIPDKLEQGIYLQYVSQPVDATEDSVSGLATFSAECRAYLPSGAEASGDVSFDWYVNDQLTLDTSVDPSSDASISSVGNVTTLTLTNIDAEEDGNQVYVVTTYSPATGEANAINSPLRSTSATLGALSEIIITEQPVDISAASGIPATVSVGATILPDNGETINYQWQLNYEDITDGTFETGAFTNEIATAQFRITSDAGDDTTLDLATLSTYSNFVSGRTYTLTSLRGDIETRIYARGAGGGTSSVRGVRGGSGGSAQGRFTFIEGQPYVLRVGGRGLNGGEGGSGGFSGGGQGGGGHGRGGGGGGFTGIFINSISQQNAILIAGGAGGGSNDPASGGNGGGTAGARGSNGGRAGGGGTQTGGGSGAGAGTSGTGLQGGTGAAGGGGGWFGGGGGQYVGGCCADGAGGGGSGFLNSLFLTNSSFDATNTAPGGSNAQDGSFKIDFITTIVPITVTISGSQTPDLTLTTEDIDFGGILRCTMTANGVQESPVFSDAVNYDVVDVNSPERSILNYEIVSDTSTSVLEQGSINLFNNPKTFVSDTSNNRENIVIFPTEKDLNIKITIAAAAGADVGTLLGGEGGLSEFSYTLKRNTEYVFRLGNNQDPYGGRGGGGGAAFFYEEGTLLACCGGGGGAGTSSNGGDGGGIALGGLSGSGGSGGGIVASGTLSVTGLANNGTVGGRVEACTNGDFYQSQGISPCASIGDNIQWRTSDGDIAPDSASLTRGFKAGGTINRNNGGDSTQLQGTTFVGGGGAGATGGNATSAATNSGGGGSGYTNGSVDVISANIGGNSTKNSYVTIELL